MSLVFDTYGEYYDLLYTDKDYVGEVAYIDNLLSKYGNGVQGIVEFGSGTGKHAALLSEKNYKIVGVEPSSTMLAHAEKQTNTNVRFICAGIEDFQTTEKFDASLALFHVVSYVNDNASLLKAFKNVHDLLTEDGIFIFDVWYTPAVVNIRPEARTKILENEQGKLERKATPTMQWNTNTVEVEYKIAFTDKTSQTETKFTELHRMRHFSAPELDLLAETSGFKLLHFEEFLTANSASESTWGVCFVLKKKSSDNT